MQVQVSVNKLNAKTRDYLNENEYHVHKIEFEFTEDYTEDLSKVAVFKQGGKNYKVSIQNNECNVPPEILAKKGTFTLGVYAYAIEDEELILRYSPSPISLFISSGSYVKDEDTENSEPLTPTDKELIMSRLEQVEFDAEQVETNTQDIADLQETKADKSEIPQVTDDYEDLSNKPSINGIQLLGNKTAEQLGITSSLCNLGAVTDYDQNNRLDLNKLSPGIYWLYRDFYTNVLYLKATYKGNEIFGQWNDGEYNEQKFILLEISQEITDDLAERTFVGGFTYFKLSTSEIKNKSSFIRISSSEINTNTSSETTMSPVGLSNNQTISGEKTFTTLPKSSVVPSDNAHFTNKAYVDSAISTAISQITDGDEVSY